MRKIPNLTDELLLCIHAIGPKLELFHTPVLFSVPFRGFPLDFGQNTSETTFVAIKRGKQLYVFP